MGVTALVLQAISAVRSLGGLDKSIPGNISIPLGMSSAASFSDGCVEDWLDFRRDCDEMARGFIWEKDVVGWIMSIKLCKCNGSDQFSVRTSSNFCIR